MVKVVVWAILTGLYIPSLAWSAGPVKDGGVEVELVSEVVAIPVGRSITIGLRLKMDDHWHTYWKNPGDAGMATRLEWDLPQGFAPGSIQWPYPQSFKLGDLIGFGYGGEVLLPVRIQVPESLDHKRVKLAARARWLACNDKQCVMGRAQLNLDLPVSSDKPTRDTRWQALFAKARQEIPRTPESLVRAHWLGETVNQIQLRVGGYQQEDSQIVEATFYPIDGDMIDYGAPQLFKWVLKWRRNGFALGLKPSPYRRTFTFRIEIDAEGDMNRGVVPDDLRQAFDKHGITLADSAAVLPLESDRAWTISDQKKAYTVTKEGKTLNVSQRLRGVLVIESDDRTEALDIDVPLSTSGEGESVSSEPTSPAVVP